LADRKTLGGKKNRKLGRAVIKCQQYKNTHTREKNKIKRVLQSSGAVAAKEYAEKNNLLTYLKGLQNYVTAI
jgi:hypothetical protein